jgi:hypothetical protein
MAQQLGSGMPLPCSSSTPYFTGQLDQSIDKFLKEYKELAQRNRLNDREWMETVIWYVAPSQKDFWISMDRYTTLDWNDFCQELCKAYLKTTI